MKLQCGHTQEYEKVVERDYKDNHLLNCGCVARPAAWVNQAQHVDEVDFEITEWTVNGANCEHAETTLWDDIEKLKEDGHLSW